MSHLLSQQHRQYKHSSPHRDRNLQPDKRLNADVDPAGNDNDINLVLRDHRNN